MNRASIWRSAALILLCLAGAARAGNSEPWPEVPLPPKSKVEWVGDSMRVNGVPTRVMRFESSAGRAEIVEYYRAYWSGGYPTKPSVRVAGDATVVGQAHGPFFMTLKVKDAPQGTSDGLIAVARVLGSRIERSAGGFALMPGAKVMQVVESNDPGKRNRQIVVSNPAAAPSVVQYYQTSLANAGWRQVQYNDTPPEAGGPSGSFLVFQRERSELQLSVVANPGGRGSMLVADLVTKDTVPQAF
jgi:hypothetical protein